MSFITRFVYSLSIYIRTPFGFLSRAKPRPYLFFFFFYLKICTRYGLLKIWIFFIRIFFNYPKNTRVQKFKIVTPLIDEIAILGAVASSAGGQRMWPLCYIFFDHTKNYNYYCSEIKCKIFGWWWVVALLIKVQSGLWKLKCQATPSFTPLTLDLGIFRRNFWTFYSLWPKNRKDRGLC